MKTKEFKDFTSGFKSAYLADLLLCSRFSIDRYRTGAAIPEKIARRVEELHRRLEEFRRTNFV